MTSSMWLRLLVCDVRTTAPQPLPGAKTGQLALSCVCLYKAVSLKPALYAVKETRHPHLEP